MDRAPSKLAVTDFAAARRTHAARLTDRAGREVVVQHEGLLAAAFQAVDELLVFTRPQGRDDNRLRLTTCQQRGAMGARKYTDFGDDRTHGDEIAAVDALLGVEHRVAHDVRFDVVHQIAKGVLRDLTFTLTDIFLGKLGANGGNRIP